MTSLALVPLRGIRFRDNKLESNPFERPWTLLSLEQMHEFSSRLPEVGGAGGNIKSIEDRIRPDAFLTIESDDPTAPGFHSSYDRPESILGALCLTTLLAPEHRDDTRQYSPRPLYWARTTEYCDLPLVFDEQRTRLSGHSSWFMWLSPDSFGIGGTSLRTVSDVERLATAGPSTVRKVLAAESLHRESERRLEAGLRAI